MQTRLIIYSEHHKEMTGRLKKYLQHTADVIDTPPTVEQAVELYYKHTYSAVIVEPEEVTTKCAFLLLESMREAQNTPIIVLSEESNPDIIIRLYKTGIDEYVTIPFDYAVLVQRVRSHIRRYHKFNVNAQVLKSEVIEYKELVIDNQQKLCLLNGMPVLLTGKEYDFLYLLLSNPNRVFTYEQIYQRIWKTAIYHEADHQLIFALVRRLRRKVESTESKTPFISNVREVGYTFQRR